MNSSAEVGPNLFIAGVSRAGTTSLHYMISSHEEVSAGLHKELWVYNVDNRYPNREEIFLSEFQEPKTTTYRLDSTPHYFDSRLFWDARPGLASRSSEKSVFQLILRDSPNARFIVSLRHPVARFVSEYLMNRAKEKPFVAKTLLEHIEGCLERRVPPNADYFLMGSYGSMTLEAFRVAKQEQFLFLLQEDWVIDNSKTVQTCFEFLGLEEPELGVNSESRNSGNKYFREGIEAIAPRNASRNTIITSIEKLAKAFAAEMSLFSESSGTDITTWNRWDPTQYAMKLIERAQQGPKL